MVVKTSVASLVSASNMAARHALSGTQQGAIFLTEEQLSQRWQISIKKLQADRFKGKGCQYTKIGRSARYSLGIIEAYEAANTVPENGLPKLVQPSDTIKRRGFCAD